MKSRNKLTLRNIRTSTFEIKEALPGSYTVTPVVNLTARHTDRQNEVLADGEDEGLHSRYKSI